MTGDLFDIGWQLVKAERDEDRDYGPAGCRCRSCGSVLPHYAGTYPDGPDNGFECFDCLESR